MLFDRLLKESGETDFDVEDWPSYFDHNELYFQGDLEIDTGSFLVYFEYTVTETGKLVPETYLQPSEWVREGLSVNIIGLEAFENSEGHRVPMDEKQESRIKKILEQKIEKSL